MRWPRRFIWLLFLLMAALPLFAAEYKMADGAVINGELVAPNEEGTVIRRTSGGLTSRLGWDRFAQETLVQFAQDPSLKELVEAYIDAPEGVVEAKPELVVKQPPGRLERPARRPGIFSAFTGTSAGWFILLVLLAANLYAAYEVAIYRNYPLAAVMSTSLILPILGPILFLCMPPRVRDDVVLESQYEAPQDVQNTGNQELAAAGLAGSGLSLSAGHKAGGVATAPQQTTYRRGEVEFNRAFFEKAFPHFFRLTRGDADKDAVISIRSGKGEVVATRISRISSNEIGLITQKGHEVQLKFSDISEVQMRSKA